MDKFFKDLKEVSGAFLFVFGLLVLIGSALGVIFTIVLILLGYKMTDPGLLPLTLVLCIDLVVLLAFFNLRK